MTSKSQSCETVSSFEKKTSTKSKSMQIYIRKKKTTKSYGCARLKGVRFILKMLGLGILFVKAGFVDTWAFPHLTMGRKNCPNFRWQHCERRELGQEPEPLWAKEKRNINTKVVHGTTSEMWYFKRSYSRWWQLKYFLCSFLFGEMIQFWLICFQMGWNHHL